MEYRLIRNSDLENEKFVYCFCGNPEDRHIVTDNQIFIYNFMGDLSMDKIVIKSTLYKLIKAFKYVYLNKEEIRFRLEGLESNNVKMIITCYDDFDLSPVLYMAINKLIPNKCTYILESSLFNETDISGIKSIYGRLYFNFIYRKFYGAI